MTGTKLAPIAETKDITEKEVKVPITPINPFEPSNKSPSTSLENNLEGLNAGLDITEKEIKVPITPINPFEPSNKSPSTSLENNLEGLNAVLDMLESQAEVPITPRNPFNQADLPINPFDSYDNNPFDDLESLNSEGYVPENSSDIEEESITSEQKFNKEMELAKQESLRDYKLGFEKDKNLFNIEIQTAITLSLKDQEKLEGKSKKNRFFSMLSNLASSPKKRNNKNSLRNDDIKKSSGNNNKKGLS